MGTVKSGYPLPMVGAGGTLSTLATPRAVRILISGRATITGIAGVTRDANTAMARRGLKRSRCGIAVRTLTKRKARATPTNTIYSYIPAKSAMIIVSSSGVKDKGSRLNGILVGKYVFTVARLRRLPGGVVFCGNNTAVAYRKSSSLRSLGGLRDRNIRVIAYKAYLSCCKVGSGLTMKVIAGVCSVIRSVGGTNGVIGPY